VRARVTMQRGSSSLTAEKLVRMTMLWSQGGRGCFGSRDERGRFGSRTWTGRRSNQA
jgi:hypothetical protein